MAVQTEAVWHAFRDPLWNYIVRRVPNASDADDVLQDVFLKVHRNLPALENEERLAPWLYRVARNTLIDRYRRSDTQEPLEATDEAHSPEAQDENAEQTIAGCLRNMINDLPPAYRDALVLSELEGLPQRVVAERLGLSLSGAKSRVQRGRRLLRDALLSCCHFEFDQRGKIMEYVPRATCCANVPTTPDLMRRLGWTDSHHPSRTPKIGNFGDSSELSTQLLQLIRDGVKTATASLVWEWEAEGQSLPEIGDVMIVLDWNQDPVMVIEYVDVEVKPFSAVTEDFAWDEGEGDRSLASWRDGHWAFFTRACAALDKLPSEDMPILYTRFRVIFDSISSRAM